MPSNKALRREWIKAGYPPDVGSAEVARPPPAGFRRVYYLTTADHAVSNIVFRRIKIARFSEVNDPFELLAPMGIEKTVRELLRQHKREIDKTRGLLCFSGDWTNPLLWSHYAARHTGVTLGFDLDESLAIDVEYEAARVTIPKGIKSVDDNRSTN
jgi:hypothetical protein